MPPDGNGTRGRPGKWTWGGLVLALLAVCYVLAGFYLVPGLIRSQAQSWVKPNLEKPLALGEIKFNPLTFTLDVSDIAIPQGTQPMVAIGHLRVSFSVLSLFQHAYYFREVRLDRPFVHAVLRSDHSLNLIELKPRTQSNEPNPAVRIGVLSVAEGRIAYADDSRAPRLEKILAPIAFTLTDFHTDRAEGGAFTLNARSERGEGFTWTGDLSIAPVSSRGRLTVTGLLATTVQDFAGDYLPVALTKGAIGFDLRYDFSYAANGPRFQMQAPVLALTDLAVDGKSLFRGTAALGKLNASIGQVQFAAAGNRTQQLRATVPQASVQGLSIVPFRRAFRNIELPVFNPYSGRYAGYAIAKGKLTTELSYKIVNRALQADHHIVIDQLEWGQPTNSKEAVPLPVRLAAVLLKDRNGVIDLKLPLTGSLDDPKFRIWPIVWQIVGNIIEKAITAPFSLIGSLFEGADKAQYVDFAPGTATLPAGSGEALGALAKALTERPELQLDIPSAPGIQEVAFAIADTEIDKQAMGKDAGKGFKSLDADDQHDDLEDVYESKLGKSPAYPEFTPDALKAVSDKADMDEDDRRQILETQWLRAQLRTSFAPPSAQLAALGTVRAQAVRDALLADGKVDPARVFLAGNLAATAASGHSRVELKIK